MKKFSNIVGIISGFISVVFSFVVKGMSIGSYERNYTYGGDAYTGIQNASAQTANNVQELADLVRTGIFAFLLVFGLALICFFLSRLVEKVPVDKNSISPSANTSQKETNENIISVSPSAVLETTSVEKTEAEHECGAEESECLQSE
ncbi:MAG: hypothetical protein J5562_02330 [Clostridia bacterium]|nr:hypothetical protein [Clostridia bacterium]